MADPNVLVPDGQGTDRRAVLVNNVEGTVIFQENERSCNAMVDVDGELHRVVLVYDLSGGGGGSGNLDKIIIKSKTIPAASETE